MKKFHTKILTQDKVIFDLEVAFVTLPIQNGLVTILNDHIPYIGVLKKGEIVLAQKKSKKEFYLTILGGIASFNNNQLIILADKPDKTSGKDTMQVREKTAKQHLKDERDEDSPIAKTAATIERKI